MRTCFLEDQLIASTLSYQDKAWKLGEEYQYFWEKELEEVVLQKCRENFQKLPVLIGKWPFLTQKWFYFTKTWHFRKSTICLKLFFFLDFHGRFAIQRCYSSIYSNGSMKKNWSLIGSNYLLGFILKDKSPTLAKAIYGCLLARLCCYIF